MRRSDREVRVNLVGQLLSEICLRDSVLVLRQFDIRIVKTLDSSKFVKFFICHNFNLSLTGTHCVSMSSGFLILI